MKEKLVTLQESVALIKDGTSLGIAAPPPMAIVREIIRQGKKDLTLYAPDPSMHGDILIGAGCIREVHFFMFRLFNTPRAHNFRRAAQSGSLKIREYGELTTILAYLAAGMGLPFIPVHGYHNDLIKQHPEWRTFPSPFDGKELLAIPPIIPDVAIIHVPKADKFGNARLEDTVKYSLQDAFVSPRMVQAGKKAIVSAEEIVPEEEIRKDPWNTSLLFCDVDAVVHAPRGAHPYGLRGYYAKDESHIAEYLEAAGSAESFQEYLSKYVHQPADDQAYLKLVGVLKT